MLVQPVGRPSLIVTDDTAVTLSISAVAKVRAAGLGVNSANALPLITAIFARSSPSFKLGKIKITRRWVRGFLSQHCQMTYRRVTNAAKKVPENGELLMTQFAEQCAVLMNIYGIDPSLVINFDQTGIIIVPSSALTYDSRNAKRVAVANIEDKRQITAVVAVSLAGDMLPMQLVFTGKTNKCHPTLSSLTGNDSSECWSCQASV